MVKCPIRKILTCFPKKGCNSVNILAVGQNDSHKCHRNTWWKCMAFLRFHWFWEKGRSWRALRTGCLITKNRVSRRVNGQCHIHTGPLLSCSCTSYYLQRWQGFFFFFLSHMVPNNGDNFAVQQKVSLRGSRGKYWALRILTVSCFLAVTLFLIYETICWGLKMILQHFTCSSMFTRKLLKAVLYTFVKSEIC